MHLTRIMNAHTACHGDRYNDRKLLVAVALLPRHCRGHRQPQLVQSMDYRYIPSSLALEGQAWLLSTCTDGDSWQVVTTRICDIATTGGLSGHHSRSEASVSCFVTIMKSPLRCSANGFGMVKLRRSGGVGSRYSRSRQGQNSPLAATRPTPGWH